MNKRSMNDWRKAKRLFLALLGTLLMASPLLSQTPPRKAPRRPAPAPTAAPGPSVAQPQMKGIWEPVNYNEDLQLTDVFFVTPEIGWVSGAAGTILKTTDAGATWVAQLGGDPQSQERDITGLRFVSETAGWAVQRTSTHTNLLHTADGESWEQVGTIPEHFTDYLFTTETEGVMAYGAVIFRTADGGRKWEETYTCQVRAELQGLSRELRCEILRMHFPTPQVGYGLGYVSGDVVLVMKTEDGGTSWHLAALLENENARRSGIFFTDENNGVIRLYSGKSYLTTDGGQTWKGMVATNLGREIRFADPEVGWSFADLCVGMGCENARLSFTTDGGRRWTSRSFSFPAGVAAFNLPRRDRAYAVGAHGMIYRYSVVPADAQVAKAIPAPAMPGFDMAVLEQAGELQQQIEALEQQVTSLAESGGGTTDVAAMIAGELSDELSAIEENVGELSTTLPQASSRYRPLNMIFAGLQLVGQLFSQAQGIKDSFSQLRQSRDLGSFSSALQQLSSSVDGMVQQTRSAFAPPQ